MARHRTFGSVRKLPSGKWRARYEDQLGQEHGKTFRTKADANAFLANVETDMGRGAWIDPRGGRTTFAQWGSDYLNGATFKRGTTRARDEVVFRNHLLPDLGAKQLSSITPLDVKRVVEKMASTLAPATVRTNYGVLKTIFNAAVAAELIVKSPCRNVKLPQAERQRPIRFVTPEELSRLAEATPVEYRPMIYLAGALGLRWSEVAGLRVRGLDMLRRTLTVSETVAEVKGVTERADVKSRAGRRTIALPTFLADMLAEHLARRGLKASDGEALLFVSPSGGPLRPANFRSRVWGPATRAAGLDGEGFTFHHLRHSAVGFLVAANAPAAVMQQRMGHASIRTTLDVYGHVLPATDQLATDHLQGLFSGTEEARQQAR